MNLVSIEHHPNGPRLRVLGYRIHHGAVGSVLLALGASACIHDHKDWREWFCKDLTTS